MKKFSMIIMATIVALAMIPTAFFSCNDCNKNCKHYYNPHKNKTKKGHVYHTYYKDIDIDTMEVAIRDEDDNPFYVVKMDKECRYDGIRMYVDSTVVYYSPKLDKYVLQFPTNDEHGNAVVDYDPYNE